MSTNLIVTDLQKQTPGADGDFIQLFELEIAEDIWIYLSNEYLDKAASTKITFRNRDNPGNTNTYQVVPVIMEDLEKTITGPLPRPTLTIANVFRTTDNTSFEGAIYVANGNSSLAFDQLLGLRIIRRSTLRKYLADGSGDANPPVEYPVDIFYLDRILEETNRTVTFELVSAFDLEGIQLPRRSVIANACSWEYQGAGFHKFLNERKGGCTWHQEGEIDKVGVKHKIYINQDDEYVVSEKFVFTTYAGSATQNDYYKTVNSASVTKINSDGSLTSTTLDEYWISVDGTDSTPADGLPEWDRIRIYKAYNTADLIEVYSQDKFNTYSLFGETEVVKDNNVTVKRLWKAKFKTQDANAHATTPTFSKFWERGDVCGKRLTSCSMRYGAQLQDGVDFNAATDVNPTTDRITLTSHSFATDQPITYSIRNGTAIAGLVDGFTYYVINIDTNTIELSLTPGGSSINITADGVGVQSFGSGKVEAKLDEKPIKPFGAFPTARLF